MRSTVLLVDDDPLDLNTAKKLFDQWGFGVQTVCSAEAALAALTESHVDLVVSDLCMPGMRGDALVSALAEQEPGLPVVLLTGHGDVRTAVEAMKRGAFDYLVKPPDMDELRCTVDRALEQGRLRRENAALRSQLASGGVYGDRLIGRSPEMQRVFRLIDRVARTDSTVLIAGETGTGKELVAQAIHYRSARVAKPLVALNCAALNENLIEAELFGHEKGAFTGATTQRRGRFEDADGGTLFLDEIAETAPAFQTKLLRVLQEGTFERVGGGASIAADVRIIAATHRNLELEVKEGRFREDLFYRINVIPIAVPPLREREGDVALLAQHFMTMYAERYGCSVTGIRPAARRRLERAAWPGNVRELQHAIERAVILSTGEQLTVDDFSLDAPAQVQAGSGGPEDDDHLQRYLDRMTREHIVDILDRSDWRKGRAASRLGVDRATLYRLIKRLNIRQTG